MLKPLKTTLHWYHFEKEPVRLSKLIENCVEFFFFKSRVKSVMENAQAWSCILDVIQSKRNTLYLTLA